MLRTKIAPLALTSLIAVSASAAESGMSYTYASLGYLQGEALDEDFSGFDGNVRIALNDSFFLAGSYTLLESDDKFFGDEIDVTQYTLGAGFHTPIAENIDFVTSLSYAYFEAETSGFEADGDGYLVSAGVRAMPTEILELSASLNYADIEDDGEFGYGLGARLFTTPILSFGLSYESADDVDTLGIDARLNF